MTEFTDRKLKVANRVVARDDFQGPAAGMNPRGTSELTDLIRRIQRERGVSIILIEHDMKLVMGLSDHILVLDHGEKIAEGRPEDIRSNPKVIEAYLGKSALRDEEVAPV